MKAFLMSCSFFVSVFLVSSCSESSESLSPVNPQQPSVNRNLQILDANRVPRAIKFKKVSDDVVSRFRGELINSPVLRQITMSKGDASKLLNEPEVKAFFASKGKSSNGRVAGKGDGSSADQGGMITNNDPDDEDDDIGQNPDEGSNDDGGGGGNTTVHIGQPVSSYNSNVAFAGDNPTIWPDPVVTVTWNTNTPTGFNVSVNSSTTIYGGGITINEGTVTGGVTSEGTMYFSFYATVYTGVMSSDGTIYGSQQQVQYQGAVSQSGVGSVSQSPITP